jgi:hypothetical protein
MYEEAMACVGPQHHQKNVASTITRINELIHGIDINQFNVKRIGRRRPFSSVNLRKFCPKVFGVWRWMKEINKNEMNKISSFGCLYKTSIHTHSFIC